MESKVLIVGGGPIGISLALSLSRASIPFLLVDPFDPIKEEVTPDNRSISISQGTKRRLEENGAWPYISPHAHPLKSINVSTGSRVGGLEFLDENELNTSPMGYNELDVGPMGYMVQMDLLRQSFIKAFCNEIGSKRWISSSLSSFSAEKGKVKSFFSNGQQCKSEILVGADGRFSKVRNLLGIATTEKKYNQQAIVFNIEHERENHAVAYEIFLSTGPLALLPTGPCKGSIVWSLNDPMGEAFLSMEKNEVASLLCEHLKELGDIKVVSPLRAYPLSLIEPEVTFRGRAVLLGDAAHAIHPLAGQAMNVGLRDAAVFSKKFREWVSLGLDPGCDVQLQDYARARKKDVKSLMIVTDGLNELFSTESFSKRTLGTVGLSLTNVLSPLKRILKKSAMGVLKGQL